MRVCRLHWVFLSLLVGCGSQQESKDEVPRAYPAPILAEAGEAVVSIGPVTFTTDELENRINRQSLFMRERLKDPERLIGYIDNEVRFELLAQEAWRRGYHEDPQIISELKRAMVQKLVREENIRLGDSISITEAELRAGFTKNKSEYNRPARVRFSQLVRNAKSKAEKKSALSFLEKRKKIILREEKKGVSYAFAREAKAHSQDLQTKSGGGDLGFKSRDELQKLYGEEVTKAIFDQLKIGDSIIVEAEDAVVLFKKTGQRNAVTRTLEMVKPRLRAKLLQEKRNKDFEALVDKLKKQGKVEIDTAVAKKIRIETASSNEE
ncbi:MAG: peptidylprolyl isomerase [Myxococcota bacterium]|nr:peptidylprolyl isomerase [Myxococcota bacterium]